MATRSRIGIVNEDGSVLSIYVHWDGYPSHNGTLLINHWTDEAKVRELMKLGNLSVLGEEIGEKHPFDAPKFGTAEYDEYIKKYGKMCRAYGRDRGEKNVAAERHVNTQAFYNAGHDYNYLFAEGQWVVQSYTYSQRLVEDVLNDKDED